jgi:hypothetical protein
MIRARGSLSDKIETILVHSQTIAEMEDISRLDLDSDTMCHGLSTLPITVFQYREGGVIYEIRMLDIGLLYFSRQDHKQASSYFSKYPELYAKFSGELLIEGGI